MTSWTKSFENIMRDEGRDPYACLSEDCAHSSNGTLRMMAHHLFGDHSRKALQPTTPLKRKKSSS